jgi:Tfp pilus tip-associated adhesin PilY1
VVVDGGTIRYWEVNDDGDDLIEAGELFETTTPPVDVSTSRSYVDERQNFANWFQYYRKRDLLTRGAIAKVITSMQGVQIGLRGINSVLFQPVLRVKVGGEDYTSTLLSNLYSYRLDAHRAATPLRSGFEEVGRYFDQDDGFDGGVGPSPIATEEDGGACQQNFAVVFTDGFYNGLPPHVSNADGDNGLPYADTGINTLADVAMHYYENDLADNVDNRVSVNPADDAVHQHLVTYGVTFGVSGTLNPDDYDLENCTVATCPPWPVPITAGNDKRYKIDDLWHATVNGRGTFNMASNPDELVQAFLDVMQNIESRIGSAASVSVNGDELYGVLGADVNMYQSSYSSDGWIGDVKAYALDPTTGEVIITSYVFSAAAELDNMLPDSRIIATYDGSSTGTPFRFNDLTTAQKNLLVEGAEADYTAATNRLNYIRGDTTNEDQNGGAFRDRYQVLGDIVHSSPVFEDGVLYAGGNDGMLHAFDASNGRELFAYVPNLVFENLKELTKPTYTHRYYVDLTPTVKSGVTVAPGVDITMLVGGLGKGGKGYYALDVTDPSAIINETVLSSKVLGEYPRTGPVVSITDATNASPIVITATGHGFATGEMVVVTDVSGNTAANGTWTITDIDGDSFSLDGSAGNGAYTSGGLASFKDPDSDDLGYSYSKPAIVMSNDSDKWLVIFGNGYNSYNGHAVLFIIDAASGTLLKKIDTLAGDCNGLSTPVAIDINTDQRVDYVYAGDLKGNMWKFDLTSNNYTNWDVAFYNGATPQPLFQAKDGINPQPITSKPDVMYHCENDGLMVVFGTGKYLGESDFLDNSLQTIYGIWDYGDDEDNSEYLGSFERGSTPQLSNQPNNVSLLQQTELPGSYFAPNGKQLRILTANAANWQTTTEDLGGNCIPGAGEGITDCDPNGQGAYPDPDHHAGWYFDLPISGERVPNDLMIRDKKAIVIGFIPENTACGSGGDSFVMEMDACSGGRLSSPQFDINDDGKLDHNDMVALTDADGNPITDGDGNPIWVVPTGMMSPGRLLPPAILKTGDEEIKYFSTNVGTIVTLRERGVPLGIIYWLEVVP